MHRHRLRVLLAMVGLVALSLPFITAADTPDPAEGEGEASASLLAAALEVTDLDGITAGALGDLLGSIGAATGLDTGVDLGLLDGLTHATTYDDPDAAASLVPLRLGSDRHGAVSAGPGERHTADPVGLSGVSALLSNATVNPFTVSADADEDGALALIDAVEASLGGILGNGLLEVGLTEVRSEVTRVGSLANQDLVVDGLALSLGDILPAELLQLLPLDALLDLIEELDALGLLDDVDGLRDLLDGLLAELDDLLGALGALDLALLDEIDASLLEELLDLQGALVELGALDTTVDGAIDELTSLIDAAGLLDIDLDAGQTIEDVLGLLGDAGDLLDGSDDSNLIDDTIDDTTDVIDDIVGLVSAQDVSGVESDLGAVLGSLTALEADGVDLDAGCTDSLSTDLLGLLADAERLESCIEDAVQDVTGLINGLVATITSQVAGLEDLLALVTDLLGDLDGLLDDLLGLVDEILGNVGAIAGLELLSADQLVLEVAAAADAEDGATRIACELGGLSVLGEALGDASCDDGELTGPALGAVAGALDVVEGVLTALPGVDAVDGLRLDLLPAATESVTRAEDGTVTATAHAVLLELVVPSVTIDPSAAVTDLLDLSALTGELLDLDGELGSVLGLLDGTGLTSLLGDAEALVGDVTGLLDGVTGLVDDLDLPVLSQTISTPSLDLVLDPTSEASFTPAQVDDPTDPTDPTDPGDDPDPTGPTVTQPAPDPTTPELPKTGGAFSLLGLLALAGAAGLRRTG